MIKNDSSDKNKNKSTKEWWVGHSVFVDLHISHDTSNYCSNYYNRSTAAAENEENNTLHL